MDMNMNIISGVAGAVALLMAALIMYASEHTSDGEVGRGWMLVILVIYSLAFHIAVKGM